MSAVTCIVCNAPALTTCKGLPVCRVHSSCGTCGLSLTRCVCNDPDFITCVEDRDRDAIISVLAERNDLRKSQETTEQSQTNMENGYE